MEDHQIASPDAWIEARAQLLIKEKEFTRLRDQLSQQRRDLPWERVEKDYIFDGPNGKTSLAELFDGKHQLLTYHFMFDPDWNEGCPHCSFWADNFDPAVLHLNQRDANLVAVSRASLDKLQAFKQRMGWGFTWVSSGETDFNYDHQASFTPQQRKSGTAVYNYRSGDPGMPDREGISVFYRSDDGDLFHTYSAYGRGIDMINGTYQLLDLVPKGRDEAGHDDPQYWVCHHDRYDG